MVYAGYDTDDLTQRQYHYFCKLYQNANILALNFLRNCVSQNYSLGKFDNYSMDCDYLFNIDARILNMCGIDLNTIYT